MAVEPIYKRKGFHAVGAGWFENGKIRYILWERDKPRAAPVAPEPEPHPPPGARSRQSLLL